jgi:hypothetical protein
MVGCYCATMTTHTIVRTWSKRGRGICWVSTINPVYGDMPRGRIERVRGEWVAYDQDLIEVYRAPGDYLDAENALLAATTWADDTTPDTEET